MYLGGPGSTGKLRVVNALWEFFGLRVESRRFRLAAYTGVGAKERRPRRDVSSGGLSKMFINELSMLGCDMSCNVSQVGLEVKVARPRSRG